ncbi:MAG TPA: prolipoprotein diacylglyceryl transferase [Candidatus Scybalocola faecavium]|nr:prolipoprotein diacylglyceryl transferase [Candidatus Scybalocola faecavium]
MNPYFEVFGKSYASYGAMAMLGCLVAFTFILCFCTRYGASRLSELYLIAFVVIFAVVGAKLLYVLGNISELWTRADVIFSSPEAFLDYLGAGFVFYGGLIGGCIGVIVYARFFKENTVKLAEAFVPAVPLFHVFGRIGCFLAGCCYGILWDGPLGVTFTKSIVAPNGISLLPIQLIEAGANVITFVILLVFKGKLKKPLQNFGLYLVIYSIERFVFEFFRGDLARGAFLNVSTSQWISLILLPVGIYVLAVKPEKNIFVWLLNGYMQTKEPEEPKA